MENTSIKYETPRGCVVSGFITIHWSSHSIWNPFQKVGRKAQTVSRQMTQRVIACWLRGIIFILIVLFITYIPLSFPCSSICYTLQQRFISRRQLWSLLKSNNVLFPCTRIFISNLLHIIFHLYICIDIVLHLVPIHINYKHIHSRGKVPNILNG